MAHITAAQVRELRDKTGAGMMDCKKALAENDGKMQDAIHWLRKKGLSSAAKKSGRVASEGLVAVASDKNRAAMVEINAETDFVARNEDFQNLVQEIAKVALQISTPTVEALKEAVLPSGHKVQDELTSLIAKIGENMTIRRLAVLSVPSGVIASYVHGALKPGVGKIGVLIALEAESESEEIIKLGRQVGMHVAAARPAALKREEVDPAALKREQDVLYAQAKESGKPDAIIDKMIKGRINKFYQEVVLLEQLWVHDNKSKVEEILKNAKAKLVGFERFHLGEGIEKEENNFAAEVAEAAGK